MVEYGHGGLNLNFSSGITPVSIEHDNRTNVGDVYIPERETFPVVVFSHGFNGYKDHYKSSAEFLAAHGVAGVTFTFCGSGRREPSGFGTTNMTLFTECEDLSAVMDFAGKIDGFNGELYLFGASHGGTVSAMVAERRAAEIKGLALLYPAFCIPDNWNERFKTEQEIPETFDFLGVPLGRSYFVTCRKLDIYEKMGEFEKPVLLFHGTEDNMVPLFYSERAAKAYPNAKLVVYEGEGHGFSENSLRDMNERLLSFIKNNE